MKQFFDKIFKRTQKDDEVKKENSSRNEAASEALSTSEHFEAQRKTAREQALKIKKSQFELNIKEESVLTPHTLLEADGKVVYIPKQIKVQEALEQLVTLLNSQEGIEAEQLSCGNPAMYMVQFRDTRTFRKVLKLPLVFHFYVKQDQKELSYALATAHWLEAQANDALTVKKVNRFNQFYTVAIDQFWEETLWACIQQYIDIPSEKDKVLPDSFIVPTGRCTADLQLRHILWLLAQAAQGGDNLAWLPISELIAPVILEKKQWQFYFLLTTQKTQILAFDAKGRCVKQFYLSHKPIVVESGMGRSKFKQAKYEWHSYLKQNSVFEEVVRIVPEEDGLGRLEQIALLNWHKKAKERVSNDFAIQLMKKKALISQSIFDELTIVFLSLALVDRNRAMHTEEEGQQSIFEVLQEVLLFEDLEKRLPQWIERWKISTEDTLAIIQLCCQFDQNNKQLKKLLPFHRATREDFLASRKHNLAKPEVFLVEMQFCEHLIRVNLFTEALGILEQLAPHLPNETLADLLPPEDANLSETEGGPPIRVKFLELMVQAKGQSQAEEEIIALAHLQPLNKNRLKQLVSIVSDNRIIERTKEAIKILAHDGMASHYESKEDRTFFNLLSSEKLNGYLVHPATQKQGAFHQIQQWIANTATPDYDYLKKFTERLGGLKEHQPYLEVIADIQVAFGMNGVEAYLARGEKSVGIQAYEGNPNFIVIGSQHLNEKSVFNMSLPAFRFALGAEMTHLSFKHTRITSQDVWQGAWQKGKVVLDTLLVGASTLKVLTDTIERTARVGNLLRKTEKMSSVANTGIDLVSWITSTSSVFSNASAEKNKSSFELDRQLLAASRLLQLTADRGGLLICGNLHDAIRAMLLTQKAFVAELPVIQRYGLTEVIMRQNEEGKFVFQHLAIRLASLISFYLSEEYSILEDALTRKM